MQSSAKTSATVAPIAPSTGRVESLLARVPRAVRWVGGTDGELELLDQVALPGEVRYVRCCDVPAVIEAIRMLRVRGAPAIGVAAGFGFYIGVRAAAAADAESYRAKAERVAAELIAARPTAVNLAWAVRRVMRAALQETMPAASAARALREAVGIAAEDEAVCRRIGEHGASLIPDGGGVLTHCNAGSLATAAYGTALSPMYVAHASGRRFRVFADETRPLLQGARLTAYELSAAGIDVSVLCDNAAASVMASGAVQLVIVGADRIAANGDTANKIGTLGVAILARHYGIPFYVAAPRSTFDPACPDGSGIPIEQRSESEVGSMFGRALIPPGVRCVNPAFDVTPAGLITGILTEVGLIKPVTEAGIRGILG
ncbi:MAG: S-methyl-5-thioribose-1-phosphate isomerase [Planctomycetia bacterium]|nr:MAG: S-methyl-5-thioribose-1-phosphate isomerase [Planctomycetia bacterium]